MKYARAMTALSVLAALPGVAHAASPATPDHVVVVIMENQVRSAILGSANAPYINNTLVRTGLTYVNAHGTDHDSQPNYLELFSGGNPGVQGVASAANGGVLPQTYPAGINIQTPTDPAVIAALTNSDNQNTIPFSTPNLGSSLAAKGKTFVGYSEDQPSAGFTGNSQTTTAGAGNGTTAIRSYAQKHNAWSPRAATAAPDPTPSVLMTGLRPGNARSPGNRLNGTRRTGKAIMGESKEFRRG